MIVFISITVSSTVLLSFTSMMDQPCHGIGVLGAISFSIKLHRDFGNSLKEAHPLRARYLYQQYCAFVLIQDVPSSKFRSGRVRRFPPPLILKHSLGVESGMGSLTSQMSGLSPSSSGSTEIDRTINDTIAELDPSRFDRAPTSRLPPRTFDLNPRSMSSINSVIGQEPLRFSSESPTAAPTFPIIAWNPVNPGPTVTPQSPKPRSPAVPSAAITRTTAARGLLYSLLRSPFRFWDSQSSAEKETRVWESIRIICAKDRSFGKPFGLTKVFHQEYNQFAKF